jgi:hypothetical protein
MKAIGVCLALVLGSAMSVGAQSVTGKWKVTYDSDMTKASGEWKARKRAEAVLELTQRGDSVFATWDAAPANQRRLTGTLKGASLTLTTGSQSRTIQENGQPVTATVRMDFTGTVSGDRMAGVMFIRINDREPPARRWEATNLRRSIP